MRSRILLTIVGATLSVAPVISSSGHPQSSRAAGIAQARASESGSGQSTSKVTKLTPEQAQRMRARLQVSHPSQGVGEITPPAGRVKRSEVQLSLDIEPAKYWVDATWNGPVTVHLMLVNRGRYPTSQLTVNPVRVDDPRTLSDPTLFNCITIGTSCGGVVPGPLRDEPALGAGETRTISFVLPPSLNIESTRSCFSIDVLFRDEENQPYITIPQTVCPSRKVNFEPFSVPTPP
jgi:hypothetical protein